VVGWVLVRRESAVIQKKNNCPFNFTLNKKILSRLAQKALVFSKSF
jgi:hypothetical protein